MISSRSFSHDELKCKCGNCPGLNNVDEDALAALQAVRDELGYPLILTSAYRCGKHPIEAAKPKPGRHNEGIAFDILVPWGPQRIEIVEAALKHGFCGFGFADEFLHIDYRNKFASWGY